MPEVNYKSGFFCRRARPDDASSYDILSPGQKIVAHIELNFANDHPRKLDDILLILLSELDNQAQPKSTGIKYLWGRGASEKSMHTAPQYDESNRFSYRLSGPGHIELYYKEPNQPGLCLGKIFSPHRDTRRLILAALPTAMTKLMEARQDALFPATGFRLGHHQRLNLVS